MPDIKGWEVFTVGKWNGKNYTSKYIDDIVDSFGKSKVGFEPPLKLGHNDEQKILQKDGLPAAGWVENLRKSGNKLLADIKDIPKKIFDLMEKKAYKSCSVEVYNNYENKEGKRFPRVLKAIALLGADIPAVEGLDDILSLYDQEGRSYEIINFEKEGEIPDKKEKEDIFMAEKEKEKENQDKMKKLQNTVDELTKKLESKDKEVENFSTLSGEVKSLQEILKTTQNVLADEKHKSKTEFVKRTVEKFIQDKKITPAQAEVITPLLTSASDSVEISVFSKEGKEEKKNAAQIIEEFISLQPEVFTDEKTQEGVSKDNDAESKIEAFCKDKGLDINNADHYERAFIAVGSD